MTTAPYCNANVFGRNRFASAFDSEARLVMQRASTITPEKISWLSDGIIPIGKVTGIVGLPGRCKSLLTTDLAAAVTTGAAWPAGAAAVKRGRVVILSAEDQPADTLVPRLAAAGANLQRVSIVRAVVGSGVERNFDLARDLSRLGKKLRSMQRTGQAVRLLVIDPIGSYLGGVDRNSAQHIRALFDLLAAFAAAHALAIVFVSHRTKTASRRAAVTQIAGSYEFGAGPRTTLLVVDEPSTGARLLVPCKQNIGPGGLAYRFCVHERTIANDICAPVVKFDSAPIAVTAEQAIAAETGTMPAVTESPVQTWLKSVLANGPRRRRRILRRAAHEGFSERQVRTAVERLRIVSTKIGRGADGATHWALPGAMPTKMASN